MELQRRNSEVSRDESCGRKPPFESSLREDKITITNVPSRAEIPRMYDDNNFNIDNYFIVFERLAVAQGWSKDKWVSRLSSQFNAKCQDIFSRIPVDSCQDFEVVKLKLLEGYNLGPESYRKKFSQMQRSQTENFKDFAVNIEDVFSKWLKGANCDTFEKLSQLLKLEKFYSGIPKDLVALLKDNKLENLTEAGKLADQLDSFRDKAFSNTPGTMNAREQNTFRNFTHHASNNNQSRESRVDSVPRFNRMQTQDFRRNWNSNKNNSNNFNKPKYYDNRSHSHNSYYSKYRKPWKSNYGNYNNQSFGRSNNSGASINYPNNSLSSFKPRVNFVKNEASQNRAIVQEAFCRFCKRKGHEKSNCNLIKLFCNNCNKNGHETQYCRGEKNSRPYNAFVQKELSNEIFSNEVMQLAKINNVNTYGLRDTGSSISLIKAGLIPDLKILPEYTVCVTAFNSRHTVQLAEVEIVTKEGSGKLKVGIVDDLMVDVILGNDINKLEANTTEFVAAITRAQAKRDLLSKEKQEQKDFKNKKIRNLAKARQFEPEKLEVVMEGDETIIETNSKLELEIPKELKINPESNEIREDKSLDPGNNSNNNTEQINELFKLESLKGSNRQEFINEQQTDPSLARARAAVGIIQKNVHEGRPNATHYFMKNKMLFRKFYVGPINQPGQSSSITQLVVPAKYRRTILSMGHDDPLASHLGIAKTRDMILKRFYWSGIFRDVKEYVLSCEKCQLVGKKVKRAKAPLVIMPTADRPWQKIIIDVVGPLEKSNKGNQYILVVIDVHSHYPEAFALKTIDSKTIAKELVKLFTRVGICTELQSDQASNFLSKIMFQLYAILGIKHISSSCYRPQTNALVERLNGTIKRLLKTCLVGRDPRNWDEILPLVLFSIRASKSETTGFSPFELMFGYEIRGPLDIVRELWVEPEETGQGSVDLHQYILDLRNTMRALASKAVEREKLAKEQAKTRFDKNAGLVEFIEGDKVFILLPQRVSSLTPSWVGPYIIDQRLGPVTYRVFMHEKSRKKLRVVHVNMMRRYIPRISCFVSTQEGEEFENETVASFPESSSRQLTSLDVKLNDRLPEIQKVKIKNLLKKFDKIFSDIPGSTDVLQHQIRTINDEPINCVPYTVPQALAPMVQKEIEVALKLGIIEPVINIKNPTAYASPTILVKKKEAGKYRICIDHRKLNLVTIPQRYRLPNASHLIEKVASARVLSLADLTKGFNQIRICEADQHKTGFLCLGKHYICKYLSFGLNGGPSTFQLLMDTVLAGMESFALSFIDDIVIFSDSFEEHVVHLERVFQALADANLTANPTKVILCMPELKFLGHLVGGGRKCVDLEKISVLENIKIPTSKRDIRKFIGFCGFYRSFIDSFSEISAPLTDLLKKSSNELIPWTPEASRSFSALKSALQKAPVLIAPDFNKTMIVMVDASQVAVGGVLCQSDHGQLRPILFVGRKFSESETRLSATEREVLGILSVLKKLRYYLLGKQFTLLTDVKAIHFIKNNASSSAKLTRWLLLMSEYDYTVGHVPGTQFTVPDYLSRYIEYANE